MLKLSGLARERFLPWIFAAHCDSDPSAKIYTLAALWHLSYDHIPDSLREKPKINDIRVSQSKSWSATVTRHTLKRRLGNIRRYLL